MNNSIYSNQTQALPEPRMNVIPQAVIFTMFAVGTLGNLLVLVVLCLVRSRPHNEKHRLMLRCLVLTDLVALTGVLLQFLVQVFFPSVQHKLWLCRLRVIWRGSGLYSGCVVIVMAVERWVALTKPFFYQKHVTILLIKKSIFGLWLICLLLVSLPLFGFGLYYDYDAQRCARHRHATLPKDIAYAYLDFVYGMSLVFCIVWCNLAVMKALRLKRPPESRQHVLIRQIGRNKSQFSNASTKAEVAFGKLMLLLCIVFVASWLPHMISIPLAQFKPDNWLSKKFFLVADILMVLHFTLNPYLYVLQRWPAFRSLFKSSSRINSSKTSYETVYSPR